MKSSQSRVAKIEAGDPSVSFDLLVRAVLSRLRDKERSCQGASGTCAAMIKSRKPIGNQA